MNLILKAVAAYFDYYYLKILQFLIRIEKAGIKCRFKFHYVIGNISSQLVFLVN
jgi:hypothetical protein